MRTQSPHLDRAPARVEIMASCRPAFAPSTDLGQSNGFMTAGDIDRNNYSDKAENSHQTAPNTALSLQ